nr:hypothetical protein [Candidatus Sigynarchaeota archaeon]
PRVVDLIEGRPVASIIHSISGKQLEEHVDVELVPMRTEQSGVECKNTGEDDRLHIQALEEFLKDLGWQEE